MIEGATTLGNIFRSSCKTYAGKTAIMVPAAEGYQDVTFTELERRVKGYAAALRNLGLVQGDRVALQCENCLEWAVTDWACQCLGLVLVPIYPTLPRDQSQYIVRDCGAKLAIAGSADHTAKLEGAASKLIQLKGDPESLDELARDQEFPESDWNDAINRVQPEDLATIIYTSGTTGNPKGVMLPHRAPTWLLGQITKSLPVDHNDVFFSFLPLSHVFERFAGHFLPIYLGATIGYAKSLASLANDIQLVKPTITLCVPRFLEAMMDRILDGVSKAPPLRQKLFHAALAQGKAKYQGKPALMAGVLDKVVGTKVRERMGGRLRFFVSGGAALAPHVAEFYHALGIQVLQGYGLTETTAGTCLNKPNDSKPWTVGEPIGDIELKIAPDGEILVRAPSVMSGYYNLPEDTAACLDADGWFHTGDIGEFEGKHIKITDRKKDILVLANGKNVAPQPIENKLKESALIAEAVLFGDGQECIYGLIIPNFEVLKMHISNLGMNPPTEDDLIKLDKVKQMIRQEIDKVNKTLPDYEKVKRHALLNAAFTVEGGELTPSMKVRRKVVREKFADVLQSIARA
jgi:long-chain acyl-CoA synthetase